MIKGQKGFMLVNMIAVIAVSSIIAIGAGMTTVQVIKLTQRDQDQQTVVRQAQNVGFSVSQDMIMARTVFNTDNAVTPDVEFITIIWKDWESGYKYDTRYVWLNSDDSLKKVIRKQTIYNENGLEMSNTSTLLADNIYSANLTQQNDTWKLIVEARSGSRSATREYEISKRME